MPRIDDSRIDLAREFRANPFGRHSADLQRILNIMRSAPVKGKHVLVSLKPHERYALGQLTGDPADPVRVFEDRVFDSLEEGEWHVFKLRWKLHTGKELLLD